MTSRASLACLLLIAAAAAGAAPARPAAVRTAVYVRPAALAGTYRLHQHDSASELALLPNGHFRFFFAAGALDLAAQGRWTSDGRNVTLNTEPRPTPPTFTPGPATRTTDAPIVVLVNGPNGRGMADIDVKLHFADGREVDGYTQDYGWHYTEEAPPGVPQWVELSLAMFGLPPHRFPLDPAAGNKFTFTLVPNDLGVQDFHDTILPITREGLVLTLMGGQGVYVREH